MTRTQWIGKFISIVNQKNPFRIAREKKGISRLEFSELLKLPRSVIEQIESDTWERSRMAYIVMVAKSLDLPLTQLLQEKFSYPNQGTDSYSEDEFEELVTRFANARVSLILNELELFCEKVAMKLDDFNLKLISFSAKNLHYIITLNEKLEKSLIDIEEAKFQIKNFFGVRS